MRMVCTVLAAVSAATAYGAELNVTVTSGGNAVVVVEPGASVQYEVTGVLSDTDNEGLSFFVIDLAFDGGPLTPVVAPSSGPLVNFTPPEGITNPEGFGGAVVDGALQQVGGSQNTPKSALMTGPVVTGVGHSPVVLASGTLAAPMAHGSYTMSVTEVLGRAIVQGDDGSGELWNTGWTFGGELGSLQVVVQKSCETFADCADLDGNGIRDDNCVWWACSDGQCVGTDIPFGDMGGRFGDCEVDGTADGNDRFAALNCFANLSADGSSPNACEDNAPNALNVDAGGAFGDCSPDGVCDGNDAFTALSAFEGRTPCVCGSGPMPLLEPRVLGESVLSLRATKTQLRAGDTFEVDVYLASAIEDLRGYQLHIGASGGRRGSLTLVDAAVNESRGSLFEDAWMAFNGDIGQLLVGHDGPGVFVPAGTYLGTFTYRLSRFARGDFGIDLLHGSDIPSGRTFLFVERVGKVVTRCDALVVRVVSSEFKRGHK